MKRRLVHALQKYILNPPVRLLLPLGVLPPTYAMLETTGRKSGAPRRNPVGNGLEGDQFWIVAEHGHSAGYVRNVAANPRVRVKARKGMKLHWRSGTAHILPDDDPRARQRMLTRGHPGRWVNAFVVRTLGTQLLTVRIDLDPDDLR
jgi:deazaflavin-dependent oxidoreductase (nitroreductase family)